MSAAPDRPLVSVLMPAYEADATLVAAAESVLAQTVEAVELIVVDDGSSTHAATTLGRLSDRRLTVARLPRNRGAAAARNAALRLAEAPVVAQLDADDLWEPDYVEQVLPAFEDPRVGLCYTNARLIGHLDGRELYIPDPALHPIDGFPGLATINPIPSATAAMRAEAVRAAAARALAPWHRGLPPVPPAGRARLALRLCGQAARPLQVAHEGARQIRPRAAPSQLGARDAHGLRAAPPRGPGRAPRRR